MLAIFGIAPWDKTLESIMRRKQKNFLDEFVGLAHSFSHAHWFLKLASLTIIMSLKSNYEYAFNDYLVLKQYLLFSNYKIYTRHSKIITIVLSPGSALPYLLNKIIPQNGFLKNNVLPSELHVGCGKINYMK